LLLCHSVSSPAIHLFVPFFAQQDLDV
jgi:hypothetical protein